MGHNSVTGGYNLYDGRGRGCDYLWYISRAPQSNLDPCLNSIRCLLVLFLSSTMLLDSPTDIVCHSINKDKDGGPHEWDNFHSSCHHIPRAICVARGAFTNVANHVLIQMSFTDVELFLKLTFHFNQTATTSIQSSYSTVCNHANCHLHEKFLGRCILNMHLVNLEVQMRTLQIDWKKKSLLNWRSSHANSSRHKKILY